MHYFTLILTHNFDNCLSLFLTCIFFFLCTSILTSFFFNILILFVLIWKTAIYRPLVYKLSVEIFSAIEISCVFSFVLYLLPFDLNPFFSIRLILNPCDLTSFPHHPCPLNRVKLVPNTLKLYLTQCIHR